MHYACMTVITIRNVPEDLNDALKARAAEQGQSLQQFLLRRLAEIGVTPETNQQRWADFFAKHPSLNLEISREDIIRAVREGRGDEA